MIVVGFWKILGVYIFIHVIFVFWASPRAVVMLSDFRKI